MALQDDLDALMQEVVTKATSMVATATPKDLALLSKATEMVRGSISLSAILQTSNSAQDELTAAKIAALSSLSDALAAAGVVIEDGSDAAILALTGQYDTYLANIQTAINAIGLRVGDVEYRILPDPAVLPDSMWALDGAVKATADCPLLVTAWGLGPGGTVCPFISRYNVANIGDLEVVVTAGTIQLPDLRQMFLRPVASADAGKYVADQIKAHTHNLANAILNTGANGQTLTGAGGTTKMTVTSPATTTDNDGSPTETFPKFIGGTALVRYK